MSEPDYYEVLGVSPTSDEVVIKAAHKAMMLKYHPDTNRSGDAEDRAKAINEAYAVLRDPNERRRYDERRARSKSASNAPHPPESDTREQQQAKSQSNPAPPPPAKAPKSRKDFIVGAATVIGCVLYLTYLANTSDEHQSTPPRFEAVQSDIPPSLGSSEADSLYGGADSTSIQPPPPIPAPEQDTPTLGEFDDTVRAGTRDFVTVVRETGIIGAHAASQSCAERLLASNNILDVDRCVAFDIAANMLDSGVSRVSGAPRNEYFAYRGFDIPLLYSRFDQFTPSRIGIISSTVEQVLNEELSKTE